MINAPPAAPVATNNGHYVAAPPQLLNLAAGSISGASYSWTCPNGFTSSLQNPSVTSISTAASGIYSVVATTNGCSVRPEQPPWR